MNSKEMKPILFNTEMVRAILEGRKTKTRRVMKGHIPDKAEFGYTAFTPKDYISCRGYFSGMYGEKFFKLPYRVGDILYVRETWTFINCGQCENELSNDAFSPGCDIPIDKRDNFKWECGCFIYRTNYGTTDDDSFPPAFKWRPSIHMPKKAARIFLRVTDVRVERLQDITEEEAEKEGLRAKHNIVGGCHSAREAFSELWDKLNAKRGYPWEANPWVWAYGFERVEKPE